jgi:hypothetical protein
MLDCGRGRWPAALAISAMIVDNSKAEKLLFTKRNLENF